MYQFNNLIKQHAQIAGSNTINGRRGAITNFDPTTWKVQVTFYPVDDADNPAGTANIPLGSVWVGNFWGAYFWPTMGAQVIVFFENGNYQNPIGITQLFDQAENRPLQGIAEGEMWLVHQSGSKICLKQDGSVSLSGNTAVNINAPSTNISLNGASLHKLVTDAFVTLFNTHTHPTPSGTSSAPTQQMSSAQLTTSLQAD